MVDSEYEDAGVWLDGERALYRFEWNTLARSGTRILPAQGDHQKAMMAGRTASLKGQAVIAWRLHVNFSEWPHKILKMN